MLEVPRIISEFTCLEGESTNVFFIRFDKILIKLVKYFQQHMAFNVCRRKTVNFRCRVCDKIFLVKRYYKVTRITLEYCLMEYAYA